jgi:hypothetical protein
MDHMDSTEVAEEVTSDFELPVQGVPLPASRSASSLEVSEDLVHDEDELSIPLPASCSASSLEVPDDESDGKGDDRGNNDNESGTLPNGEQASGKTSSAQVVDGLKSVTSLMQKLGVAPVASILQRGQQHEALIKHPRALRTYESAHLDGAWILGDGRTGSNTPYGKRLHRLGVLGGKMIRTQSLAFHGSETSVSPDSEPCPYLSNMHINVPSVPGMVVFSPSHNPGAVRKGFRDPLMYHIQVSFAYIDRTCYSLLTVLIAPTPLHAVSCACQKPHRGSRTLEESRGEWNKV